MKTRYRKEFCTFLIEHMKFGHSFSSFPAALLEKTGIRVAGRTMRLWTKTHPEFQDALELGRSASLMFFEAFMRYHVTGAIPKKLLEKQTGKMSVSMVIFALKTRFYKEYGDVLKHQGSDDEKPIKITSETNLSGVSDKAVMDMAKLLLLSEKTKKP